ncbi:MAG TPA: hypothetical protein VGJ72_09910 [Polaromonas sp.]
MIYTKTELGQSALQNRSLALTPRQRSTFIMFDGKRSTADVLKATAGLGVTVDDVNHLVTLGLLAASAAAPFAAVASQQAPAQGAGGVPSLSSQAHYSKAYPIATRLTAGLGLRGFRLNLAIEAAGDLAKLQELAPKIKEAVGPEKFRELESALYD